MGSSRGSTKSDKPLSEQWTKSWDNKPLRAIVYDPFSHGLSTEELKIIDSKSDSFKVHLPWWRNRVDIYVDEEARSEFLATVKLDRLGRKRNWQRRFRHNYTTLYVKGLKPKEAAEIPSDSALSATRSV